MKQKINVDILLTLRLSFLIKNVRYFPDLPHFCKSNLQNSFQTISLYLNEIHFIEFLMEFYHFFHSAKAFNGFSDTNKKKNDRKKKIKTIKLDKQSK